MSALVAVDEARGSAMEPTTSAFSHEPVLAQAVRELAALGSPGLIVDGTVGGAGHAQLLLEASPGATLLGLDRDPAAVAVASSRLARFGARARVVHARFSEAARVVGELGLGRPAVVLVDLGVSSHQLDTPARGFSFRAEAPLDMRMDTSRGETVAELLAHIDEHELATALRELGEERYAGRVARAILTQRPTTTLSLARVVEAALPKSKERIHPATRTFQALRMLVNRELGELDEWLASLPDLLADGGVALAISFHSLEDRAVKSFFRAHAQRPAVSRFVPVAPESPAPIFAELTHKPVWADEDEVARNPRARSARLRAVRRVPRGAA